MDEIRNFDRRFCILFCYAPMICNTIADRLAKYALNCKQCLFSYSHFPKNIRRRIDMDGNVSNVLN